MKKSFILSLMAALLAGAGCASSSQDKGPYRPQLASTASAEAREPFVLMDPGVQYSVTCYGLQEAALPDGRLQVQAHIRNRENRRIEVQANCVFKDLNGFSTDDETPFQTVILTENATEDIRFTSINNKAKKYTIRIRQAR
jgi:uncharacterized protein YcfL